MHLLPTQFVDAPFAYPDGAVSRLAGGMQWFAAYEVREGETKRIVPVAEIAALGLPDEPPAPPPTATLAIQIDELFGLCGADKPEGLRPVELVGHLEAELVGSVDEGGKKITDRIDALRAIFN